jgi:hypothetical protein
MRSRRSAPLTGSDEPEIATDCLSFVRMIHLRAAATGSQAASSVLSSNPESTSTLTSTPSLRSRSATIPVPRQWSMNRTGGLRGCGTRRTLPANDSFQRLRIQPIIDRDLLQRITGAKTLEERLHRDRSASDDRTAEGNPMVAPNPGQHVRLCEVPKRQQRILRDDDGRGALLPLRLGRILLAPDPGLERTLGQTEKPRSFAHPIGRNVPRIATDVFSVPNLTTLGEVLSPVGQAWVYLVGRQAHGARDRRFRQGDGASRPPESWGQPVARETGRDRKTVGRYSALPTVTRHLATLDGNER